MKKGNVRELLERLRTELQRAEGLDADAQRRMEALYRDVERLEKADRSDIDSLWNRARELETRFAAGHPTLERIARDLADAVAKMGV